MAQSHEELPPLGYLLTKLARATTVRFAAAIATLDVHPRHYGALVTLSQDASANQHRIAQLLGIAPSAMVTVIDELEAMGAVARLRDPKNRRQFILEVTAEGRALLARATQLGNEVDDDVWGVLTPEDRAILHQRIAVVAGRLD
jgi:DNA-binding MarR family transcriptional regulator